MKLEKDNDYDFKIYEEDQTELDITPNKKKSKITTFRSKFSPGQFELESLSILKSKISEYGIKVASNTDEVSDLWLLYACLNNYWSRVKPIFGLIITDKVKDKDQEVLKLLIDSASKDSFDYRTLHCVLLEYRDMILDYSQNINLGIEVERASASAFKSAEQKIVQ